MTQQRTQPRIRVRPPCACAEYWPGRPHHPDCPTLRDTPIVQGGQGRSQREIIDDAIGGLLVCGYAIGACVVVAAAAALGVLAWLR